MRRIIVIMLLCAALAGCGSTAPGERAIVEMTKDGWVCTNCAELIPIGPDDRPLQETMP